jgi:hypothetical protein
VVEGEHALRRACMECDAIPLRGEVDRGPNAGPPPICQELVIGVGRTPGACGRG